MFEQVDIEEREESYHLDLTDKLSAKTECPLCRKPLPQGDVLSYAEHWASDHSHTLLPPHLDPAKHAIRTSDTGPADSSNSSTSSSLCSPTSAIGRPPNRFKQMFYSKLEFELGVCAAGTSDQEYSHTPPSRREELYEKPMNGRSPGFLQHRLMESLAAPQTQLPKLGSGELLRMIASGFRQEEMALKLKELQSEMEKSGRVLSHPLDMLAPRPDWTPGRMGFPPAGKGPVHTSPEMFNSVMQKFLSSQQESMLLRTPTATADSVRMTADRNRVKLTPRNSIFSPDSKRKRIDVGHHVHSPCKSHKTIKIIAYSGRLVVHGQEQLLVVRFNDKFASLTVRRVSTLSLMSF
ncbi:hypothetical protein Ciccas_010101 [Cichlidogyrus casuarinus]|uniref:Uncharacterized protein n=1 Tax=Cichlidogyrus casuarinus TaxID=1844966 RepID=A0ABD2PVV8_9PLAT